MASISISESKPTFFSKGRYVNIQEITKIDDWDSIFKHVIGVPLAVYDTAQLIYDKEFLGASLALQDLGSERTTRLLTLLKDAPQGKAGHKSRYPNVMYIPLYCSLPGFRRCILHVETTDMDQLFIPVEVTYHVNHLVAKGIEQVFFSKENCSSSTFITDNELVHYYTVQNEDCKRRIKRLIEETDNFEEFNQTYQIPLSNLFTDPDRVAYAKSNIIYCDPDIDPIGFKESTNMWKEIIYPKSSKEAFLQFIFNQINIHRTERIKWQSKNPELNNPFILPSNEELVENPDIHKRHNLANQYINKLWKSLNEDERLQVILTEIKL
jgi:hypothetical protein